MADSPTFPRRVLALVTGQGLSPAATLIRHSVIILIAENVVWWHRHRLSVEFDAVTRRRPRPP
jgi:hypothetical protein